MRNIKPMDIKFISHKAEVEKALHEAVEKALESIGIQATSHAKQNLDSDPMRIDTGLLVNSITWALDGGEAAIDSFEADRPRSPGKEIERGSYSGTLPEDSSGERSVSIGSNVEYAIYVHEGTSRMAPNRFLKNAVVKHKDEYKKIVEDTLKNA